MICFLNASDYPAGSNGNASSLYRVTDTSSSSSDSPDSPIFVVSSSSNSSPISPRPSTPNCHQTLHGWKRFLVSDASGNSVLHHFESPSGQVFTTSEEAKKYLLHFSGLTTEVNFGELETHFLADNIENDSSNTSVPYTFCDMSPNIVDVKRRKSRKPSREFSKRRRKSTTNVGGIQSRGSTNTSSTSLHDDFDDVSVTSPLTLELQELLSEVIKSVANRLDRVDEEVEQEIVEFQAQTSNNLAPNDISKDENVKIASQNVDSNAPKNVENIQDAYNVGAISNNLQNVEKSVPNVEELIVNKDLPNIPTLRTDIKHVVLESNVKPEVTSNPEVITQNQDSENIGEKNSSTNNRKMLKQLEGSKHSAEQKTEDKMLVSSITAAIETKLASTEHVSSNISLETVTAAQGIFLNKRVSARRNTTDDGQTSEDKPERKRRSSAVVSLPVVPTVNQPPLVEAPPVDILTEEIVFEICVPKMRVKLFDSQPLQPKKRPASLDLSLKLESKLKRLSGSLTPDPDTRSMSLDLIKSYRSDSSDILESPPPCSDLAKEVVSLSCDDDFEDEIAACNDFEEIKLDIVEVFSNDGDLDQLDEQDPLALSDKDISSPLPPASLDVSKKVCRIDMVDMFYQTPLDSYFCCGCSRPYSQADLFTFNLKASTMYRICRFCFWWTSRHVGTKNNKF